MVLQWGHLPPVFTSKLVLQQVHRAFTGLVLGSTAEAEAEADDEVVGVGCPTGPGEGFRAAIISSWAHLVVTLTFFLILTLLLTHFEL